MLAERLGLPARQPRLCRAQAEGFDPLGFGLPVSQRAFIMNLTPQGIADQIRVARRLGDLTQREEIDVLRRALAAPGVNRLAQTQKVGTEAGRVDQFERPLDLRERFHIRIHGPRVVGGAQIAFSRARGLAAAIPMQCERACEFIAWGGGDLFHNPRHAPMPPRAAVVGDHLVRGRLNQVMRERVIKATAPRRFPDELMIEQFVESLERLRLAPSRHLPDQVCIGRRVRRRDLAQFHGGERSRARSFRSRRAKA